MIALGLGIGLVVLLGAIFRSRERAWKALERDLIATYGREQIAGLTAREVLLLLRVGLLKPLPKPDRSAVSQVP